MSQKILHAVDENDKKVSGNMKHYHSFFDQQVTRRLNKSLKPDYAPDQNEAGQDEWKLYDAKCDAWNLRFSIQRATPKNGGNYNVKQAHDDI